VTLCKLKENPKGKSVYNNYIIRKYPKQLKEEKKNKPLLEFSLFCKPYGVSCW